MGQCVHSSLKKANGRLQTLKMLLEDLSHWLPTQPPLHAFVHHNTLHHFEEQRFEEAVVSASERFRTEPFLQEEVYRQYWHDGRISDHDIHCVISEQYRPENPSALSTAQLAFQQWRMTAPVVVPDVATVRFLETESTLLERLDAHLSKSRVQQLCLHWQTTETQLQKPLTELWQALVDGAKNIFAKPKAQVRVRDYLLNLTGRDSDELVHPLLIRLSGAFLDQGVAHWPMPNRERGFLRCFRELYRQALLGPNPGFENLKKILNEQHHSAFSALQTIDWALSELGIPKDQEREFLLQTLLALRGWAGMFCHLQERPDHAPIHEAFASLEDFLAVRLLLEVSAASHIMNEAWGSRLDWDALQRRNAKMRAMKGIYEHLPLAYEAFICAQHWFDQPMKLLQPDECETWLSSVYCFNDIVRRKLWHLAFERRYRVQILDALSLHGRYHFKVQNQQAIQGQQQLKNQQKTYFAQAVFCIDDREESLRRHLEEYRSDIETFGFAGFFGAAIEYQGMDDIRSKPLCPVVIRPKHFIREVPADVEHHERYKAAKKRHGRWQYFTDVASKTLTRGSFFSAFAGWLSLPSLILRSLSPATYLRFEHLLHGTIEKPVSRLQIEHHHDCEGELKIGYSVREMCDIVENTLRTMNLCQRFSQLIVFVGHGSSSLNNPHEAAHDCGATGGGRGGPNARVFAAMANHPMVRQTLAEKGMVIPSRTWFVGAYHNTCDDAMTYYDEDLIPSFLQSEYSQVKAAFAQACIMDAHERCRRFETTPINISPSLAQEYAQVHANDLAEPRPEYGHATNSICIVGRRARTRGLFLDRRAFLVSYDPTVDAEGAMLSQLLQAVGPVGAGINLEYYFSYVDPAGYGCGTKLPHNITGLIGVMDGHATDLRTGLPWQMVEIHEPVRLLLIVEAKTSVLEGILARVPGLARLVENRWIQLAALDPDTHQCHYFTERGFELHNLEAPSLNECLSSQEYYQGHREHLPPAHIRASL